MHLVSHSDEERQIVVPKGMPSVLRCSHHPPVTRSNCTLLQRMCKAPSHHPRYFVLDMYLPHHEFFRHKIPQRPKILPKQCLSTELLFSYERENPGILPKPIHDCCKTSLLPPVLRDSICINILTSVERHTMHATRHRISMLSNTSPGFIERMTCGNQW